MGMGRGRTGKGRKPKGVVKQRKRSQAHAWQTRTTGQRANRLGAAGSWWELGMVVGQQQKVDN